jgi:hypothetical protein
MNDTIPVVYESEALDNAEALARTEYADIPLEALEADEFRVRTDSAHWANGIAPELRALSGFEDTGYGTYQQDRDIALVPVGCGDDSPAEAELLRAKQFSVDVFEAYRDQAYECFLQQRQEAGIDES